MKKEPNFEFYVLNYDVNARKVINYNIFDNGYVYKQTCKYCQAYYDNILEFDWFVKKLDNVIRYEEWGRCEYEIAVGDCIMTDSVDKLEKWDCYSQAKPNIEIIARYCLDVYSDYLCKVEMFDEKLSDEECSEYKAEVLDEKEPSNESISKAVTEKIKSCKTTGELFDNLVDIVGKEIDLEKF